MSATNIFPVPDSHILLGFTTSGVARIPRVAVVPLADKELGVLRVTSSTTHQLRQPPIPVNGDKQQLAWEALYPAGSINPGNKSAPPGGFGFYLRGPPSFAGALQDSSMNREVLLGYDVLFEDGFRFQKGGKLPGMYGGVGESAYGCTGGRQHDRCRCFNLRLMWRDDGVGELYAYVPQNATNTEQLLSVPPRSIQHPDYGFSVGRGAWKFQPGRWTHVMERVKLNDVGEQNGEIEVFIDGNSVILATGLVLRTKDGREAHVQGLHFQTFFGGHAPDWASPEEQRAWFANVSGAILRPSQGRGGAHGRDEL